MPNCYRCEQPVRVSQRRQVSHQERQTRLPVSARLRGSTLRGALLPGTLSARRRLSQQRLLLLSTRVHRTDLPHTSVPHFYLRRQTSRMLNMSAIIEWGVLLVQSGTECSSECIMKYRFAILFCPVVLALHKETVDLRNFIQPIKCKGNSPLTNFIL